MEKLYKQVFLQRDDCVKINDILELNDIHNVKVHSDEVELLPEEADESGAGGLWDLSGLIIEGICYNSSGEIFKVTDKENINDHIGDAAYDKLQGVIYNLLRNSVDFKPLEKQLRQDKIDTIKDAKDCTIEVYTNTEIYVRVVDGADPQFDWDERIEFVKNDGKWYVRDSRNAAKPGDLLEIDHIDIYERDNNGLESGDYGLDTVEELFGGDMKCISNAPLVFMEEPKFGKAPEFKNKHAKKMEAK